MDHRYLEFPVDFEMSCGGEIEIESTAAAAAATVVAVGAKKRRLSMDQVASLETRFHSCTKLEPKRNQGLAEELGLQPRQVAIWFQNRRARGKAKQMECDFHTLSSLYHALLQERDQLRTQVADLSIKLKVMMKEMEGLSISSHGHSHSHSHSQNLQQTGFIFDDDDAGAPPLVQTDDDWLWL